MPSSPSGSPSTEPSSATQRTPKPSERAQELDKRSELLLPRRQLLISFVLVPIVLACLYAWLKPTTDVYEYIGIGVSIWAVLVVGILVGVLEWTGSIKNRWMHVLLIPYILIAIDLGLYESTVVNVLGVLSLIVLFFGWLALATHTSRGVPLLVAGQELFLGILHPFLSVSGLWKGVDQVGKRTFNTKTHAQFRKVIIGLLVALPIVVVFVALLSSADPIFRELFERLWSLEFLEDLGWEVVRWILHVVIAAGLVGYVTLRRLPKREALKEHPAKQQYIQKTVLSALIVLFAAFMLVQIRAAFGGDEYVQEFNLTYSDYARQGFFQLWWVSALALAVSGAVYWKTDRTKKQLLMSGLQGTFLGLTLLMAGTAMMRLQLYVTTYGLTHLRLFAFAGIILAAIALGVQAVVVLTRKPVWWFTTASVWLVIGWITIMLTMNMDWQIANYNVSLAERGDGGYELDMRYLNRDLSLDAVSVFDRVAEQQREYCGEADIWGEYSCGWVRWDRPDIDERLDWRLETVSHWTAVRAASSSYRPYSKDEARAIIQTAIEETEREEYTRCQERGIQTLETCFEYYNGQVSPEEVDAMLEQRYFGDDVY